MSTMWTFVNFVNLWSPVLQSLCTSCVSEWQLVCICRKSQRSCGPAVAGHAPPRKRSCRWRPCKCKSDSRGNISLANGVKDFDPFNPSKCPLSLSTLIAWNYILFLCTSYQIWMGLTMVDSTIEICLECYKTFAQFLRRQHKYYHHFPCQ